MFAKNLPAFKAAKALMEAVAASGKSVSDVIAMVKGE